jgi:G3E family GTPase
MNAPIPLTVIGGFLGSGKTSLLNHWLEEHPDKRTALLINDFGSLNIDASLIAQQNGDTLALTNGCVCCSLGDDLSLALIKVLDTHPPFEAVMIEASGVSDPGRIARMAQAAPELQRDAVLVLVDASAILTQWQDKLLLDTLQRQLQAADVLVLNKLDLVDEPTLTAVEALLAAQAPGVAVVPSTQGRVPISVLSACAKLTIDPNHDLPCSHSAECLHPHPVSTTQEANLHTNQFETWSAHPIDQRSFEDWRDSLEALPTGILRLKGVVATHKQGWLEVQRVGRRLQLRPTPNAPTANQAVLVAIGLRGHLPLAALEGLASAD